MTNWSELSLFVGAVSASIASLVLAVQKSKCTTISCGCVKCERDVTSCQEDTTPNPSDTTPSRSAPLDIKELEANLRRV